MTDRKTKASRQVALREGEPALFGAQKELGLVLNYQALRFEVAEVAEVGLESIYVHDPSKRFVSQLLAELSGPELPTPIGVLHAHSRPTYDEQMNAQLDDARRAALKTPAGEPSPERPPLQGLLNSGNTWRV